MANCASPHSQVRQSWLSSAGIAGRCRFAIAMGGGSALARAIKLAEQPGRSGRLEVSDAKIAG